MFSRTNFKLSQESLYKKTVSNGFSNVRLSDSFDVLTGGSPPPDRTKVVYELMSVSLPLFTFMAVVTSLAILISLFFLWFNIAKRNVRYDVLLVMIGRTSGVLLYHKAFLTHRTCMLSFVYKFPVLAVNAQTRDDFNVFVSPVFLDPGCSRSPLRLQRKSRL